MNIKVIMIPKNHEYIKTLTRSLLRTNIQVALIKPFHYSIIFNFIKLIIFRIRGYRIIHVHWLYVFPLIFIMKIFCYVSHLLNMKIVYEMHQVLPHDPVESDKLKYSWFCKNVDGIIYHHKCDRGRVEDILNIDEDKPSIVIPHGNFNSSYLNNISKDDARMKLDIDQDSKVVLCFGSIRKYRGYRYLVEAASHMKDIIFLIVGKPIDKEEYEKLKQYEGKLKNIKLISTYIPDNELQIYFNSSDIVILPYTQIYTSGIVPLAYAFSRPIIASDIGGIKEVVNEKTGMLVPAEDSDALKKAIEDLLKMDYIAMGNYAYEYAEAEFNWDRNASKIGGFYKQILSNN